MNQKNELKVNVIINVHEEQILLRPRALKWYITYAAITGVYSLGGTNGADHAYDPNF